MGSKTRGDKRMKMEAGLSPGPPRVPRGVGDGVRSPRASERGGRAGGRTPRPASCRRDGGLSQVEEAAAETSPRKREPGVASSSEGG